MMLAALLPMPLLLVKRYRKTVLLACLCLLTLSGGALTYQTTLITDDSTQVRSYNDSGRVVLRGVVSVDPDVRDKTTRLKLSVQSINPDGVWRKTSGMVMLYVPRYPEHAYGDLLEVTGVLATPTNFTDDFDYQGYLAKQSVYSTMLYPEIHTVGTGYGIKPLQWIYSLRHALAGVMAKTLPEPQASLAQGIVLGLRGNIPDNVNDDFARSGTTHVLAISGANLTILAGLLMLVLGRIIGKRYRVYIWLTLVIIWFYTMLAGASPPVVRAAIMATLFLFSELLGRQKNAGPALAFAAAIMVAANPLALWDVSFQLSVLAMSGIIFLYPVLYGAVAKWTEKTRGRTVIPDSAVDFIAEGSCMTLAASLTVWPASAAYFGTISLASPVATLLSMPVLGPIMVIGLLGALAGLIWLPAAQVIAWAVWMLTSYMLLVARVFANVPTIDTSGPRALIVIAYYAVLAVGVIWFTRSRRKRFMAEMGIGKKPFITISQTVREEALQ